MGSDKITVNKVLGRRTQKVTVWQREEWRGRYNMTFCSYCLMALKVDMIHDEFIIVGLGVGL
jgi:hypothetical protein